MIAYSGSKMRSEISKFQMEIDFQAKSQALSQVATSPTHNLHVEDRGFASW